MSIEWSLPKLDGLLCVYTAKPDQLTPVDGQGDISAYADRAARTNAIWQAVRQVADTATMIIKSPAGMSIGMANGGLIAEGTSRLNVGLLRASARGLDPVPAALALPAHTLPDTNPFHRVLWQVLIRLHGTYSPRTYRFQCGEVTGIVQVAHAALRFGDGFTGPTDFAAAIEQASAAGNTIAYTIDDNGQDVGGDSHAIMEILHPHVATADGQQYRFDSDGWPLACPADAGFDTILGLSAIARDLVVYDKAHGTARMTAMSKANAAMLTGDITAEGEAVFVLQR